MLDVFSSWATWLVGGSMLTALVVAALAYAVGAQKAVELVVSVLQPIAAAIGGAIANAITVLYENTRDGLLIIGKSGKALLALAVMCLIVAVSVYVPTVRHTKKKTWGEAHHNYTLLPKRKAAGRVAKTDTRSETLRNFGR